MILFINLKQPQRARAVVLVGGELALLILIVKLVSIAMSDQPFYAQVAMKAVKVHFKFGLVWMLVGLGLMLLGGGLLKKPGTEEETVPESRHVV